MKVRARAMQLYKHAVPTMYLLYNSPLLLPSMKDGTRWGGGRGLSVCSVQGGLLDYMATTHDTCRKRMDSASRLSRWGQHSGG
jgi:hypothetical protein